MIFCFLFLIVFLVPENTLYKIQYFGSSVLGYDCSRSLAYLDLGRIKFSYNGKFKSDSGSNFNSL